MGKIGILGTGSIPEKIRPYLCETDEEFLVVTGDYGAGAGSIGGSDPLGLLDYFGRISLADGEFLSEKGGLAWSISQEDWDTRRFAECFDKSTIYRIRGRRYHDRNRIFALEILEENVRNAELEAVLDEYHKEVFIESAALGKMVLDKNMNVYTGEADWCGTKTSIMFDIDDEEELEEGLAKLERFFADAEEWDGRMRQFAAQELTELANDWKDDEEWSEESDKQTPPITEEEFARRLHSPEIAMTTAGDFTVYYNDDEMFWGHVVTVYGNIDDGIESAEMEG